MSYRNKYKYKRKPKAKISKTTAKAVRKIVKKQIDSVVSPEEKFHSTILSQVPVAPATGIVDSGTLSTCDDLLGVPQSTTPAQNDSTRIGDDVRLKRLNIRISFSADTTYIQGTLRMLIFQWHQDSTVAPPTPVSIYMPSVSGSYDALSNFNEDSRTSKLFTVLYDKTMPMMLNTIGRPLGGDQSSANINVNLKWAKKTIYFTAGATTGKDHIFLLVNTDRPAGAGTDNIKYKYNARMHFTDS